MQMAYELEAEPEGGDEMVAVSVMEGSKVKNMGECSEVKDDEEGQQVYDFWMTAVANGEVVKKLRTQISKDAAKSANFPGFRKGQVPPYAQPQMTMFAVQEGIINTCESAVEAYGLKALKGSAGSVDVKEQVKDICAGYKVGTDIPFTATFKATYDPDKNASIVGSVEEETAEEEVVNVEVEVEESEEEPAATE